MKKTILVSLLASCGLFCAAQSTFASQLDLDREIAQYTQLFSKDDVENQRVKIDELAYKGISSPQVYDLVAKKLEAYTFDEKDAEKSAWYAKALAASGDLKYKVLLSNIRDNSGSGKIRRYAKQSLLRLENHKRWNPIISANTVNAPDGGLEQQRLINMLGAPDLELVRLAAKGVYKKHSKNNAVVDAAAKRLESEFAGYRKGDTMQMDVLSWLTKGVGLAADQEHKALLTTISKTAKKGKLKKYAKQGLKNY